MRLMPFTVIDLLGEPKACVWGKQVLDMTDLPDRHIMIYPNGFHVFIAYGKIIEIRFEDPASGYRWHDQLAIGDSLEKALEIVGTPRKTVEGQENTFENAVLYRDIEGKSGHHYYARWDLDVRLWFVNDQVRAIYVTRSDYHDGPSSGELSLENLPVTSTINEQGHIVDKVDYPFVNDPNVLGYWRSVDFCKMI